MTIQEKLAKWARRALIGVVVAAATYYAARELGFGMALAGCSLLVTVAYGITVARVNEDWRVGLLGTAVTAPIPFAVLEQPLMAPGIALLMIGAGGAPGGGLVAGLSGFAVAVGMQFDKITSTDLVASFVVAVTTVVVLRDQARHHRDLRRLQAAEQRRESHLVQAGQNSIARLSPDAVAAREREAQQHLKTRLTGITATVRKVLGAYSSVLYLRDEHDQLRLAAVDVLDRTVRFRPSLETADGVMGWVFRHVDPFLAMEYAKSVSGLAHYDSKEPDIKSFLAVPVADEESCIGVLAVDSLEVQAFSEEEHRQILEILASQVLNWTEYSTERQQTIEELEHWRAFFEVAHGLQRAVDLGSAVEYFLDLVDTVTRAELIILAQPLADSDQFEVVQARGELTGVQAGKTFSSGESWAGWALEQPGVRGISDLTRRNKDLPLLFEDDGVPGEGSAICIPAGQVNTTADAQAGLILWSHRPDQFSIAESDVLQRMIAPFQLAYERAMAMDALEALATTDALTGLANRRVGAERLGAEIDRSDRSGKTVSIVLMDIDHFKSVNDTWGHNAGDIVLKTVAGILSDSVRSIDVAVRHGGEEFLLILPETGLDEAVQTAERVRKRIARASVSVEGNPALQVTASFGVAEAVPGHEAGPSGLLQRADEALYAAKEGGRDQVCLSRPDLTNRAAP